MPGMTLRLDDVDHHLLRLLTLVQRKSANQLIIELLRAEFDKVMPGKRQTLQDGGDPGQRLRETLGIPALPHDPAADAALWARLTEADTAAKQAYGIDRQDAA